MLKEKACAMFYIDHYKKSLIECYFSALKTKKYFKKGASESIVIFNLDTTRKLNFVIESFLKSKQKKFLNTLYVKDKASILVKEWRVQNDASNIIIFSKEGRILFYKSLAMNKADIQNSFKIIEENL